MSIPVDFTMSASHPYKRSQYGETSKSNHEAVERNQSDLEYFPSKMKGPSKETKRIRGEIACAECRRLKIRCDRTIPCSTCVKRGCGALCPNGTIPPGEGSRFVLAATIHLRRKMSKLEARMHSLEDALAIIQASESDHPHHLLDRTHFTEEALQEEPQLNFEQTSPSALADTLGTLHIDGEDGASRFFGPSGDSETLLLQAKVLEAASSSKQAGPILQDLDPSYLPLEINRSYQSFPFTPPGISVVSVQSMIESYLPAVDRAIVLCDTFLEHLSWMFSIVSRRQLVLELIPPIYKQRAAPYGPHDLALLLVVLGIGALVDLTLPPYNLEAQHYYRLARAAMALQPVMAEQSVVTIKVLHLMSIYNGMSGKEINLDQCYSLLDFAGQAAVRIGFHIDPSLWGFEGKEAYDRRGYFWNLVAAIMWQSLVTGRPPVFLSSFIDCRIPTPAEESTFQQGEVPLGFGIWGFRASLECLIPVVEATLSTKPPEYAKILELDRRIRNFVGPQADPDPHDERTAISMRIFVRSHYQELILLFLHRAFFAQAITEHPFDPLKSPYKQSFLAAYQSSCVVLDDTREQYTKKPLLCARVWQIWSFAFAAAVVVGTVAGLGQDLNLTPPPLQHFEATCTLFLSAAETSSRAARALPILRIMRQRARDARDSHHRQSPENELKEADGGIVVFDAFSMTRSTPSTNFTESSTKPHHLSSRPTSTSEGNIIPPQIPHMGLQMDPSCPARFPASVYPKSPSFAGLPRGWDGTYCTIPEPLRNAGLPASAPTVIPLTNPVGEGAMLDDRWATFVHNYGILADSQAQTSQHYH